MRESYTSHSESIRVNPGKRILGLPERLFYRLGVLVFYALLFFMISYFSHQVRMPESSVLPDQVESSR
ncbi:MAG: hypothetical protein U0X76_12940 [Bacteroidia bacterium]